jgi:alanyl-tRNA synthetase
MSLLWIFILAGVATFSLINAYWWKRIRTVERSKNTSEEWDEAIESQQFATGTADSEREALLNRAAAKADVPPEDLPQRIDVFDEKIRDLQLRIEEMRAGWVSTHWRALDEEPIDLMNPHVVVVDLEGGEHDDARAFGIHAMEQDQEVVIAVAHADEAFAVGVSEPLTDQFGVTADEIANELTAGIAGGGGGTDTIGGGNVEDVDALSKAIAEYRPELEATLERQPGSSEPSEQGSPPLDGETKE